ncbi:MAG TPA: hypothetical protein VFV31_08495 [Chitinophagaceae bacterium]|nr:hypothetical protein [Chitinophagaceae bacterium]
MKIIQLLLGLMIFFLSGCWGWQRKPVRPVQLIKVWGYKPVFTTDTAMLRVQSEPPRSMKNPGKIYVRGNLLFQNDIGYGIHIIDNSIPSQARAIGFIKVNGSSEISITGNFMYVNSFNTLVVLNVADWQNVTVVKRIPDAFQQGLSAGNYQHYYIPPPEHGVYYDCSMTGYQPGMLQSGWVRDSVYNMCYYK